MGKRNHQEIPAADDLAGWKEADSRLHRRIGSIFQNELLPSRQAAEKYFGDSDVESFFDAHYQRSVIPAYATWCFLHYRTAPGAKTEAEKLLARDLPEAQAILLRAKLNSFPSLYRVVRHDPAAGTIELEDVLLGGTQTIHDKAMSECVEDGLFLPLRLIPVGRFHFIDVAGAPLGRAMGTDAVEFLRGQGLAFTEGGLREGAHWFGRLWAWSDEWEDRLRNIQLKNMDGDELLWQIASFSMADSKHTRKVLESRDDIECDEDAFSWVQTTGKAAGTMGGAVNLARIELVGDELIVTINSASRLAKAREWLEQIPGVKLIDIVTRPWNEPEEDRPADEQLKDEPVEMTPDLIAAVQQQMDTHYINWLDSPLPILSGKTPREVCQTAEGKTRVAALIRTIQEPMGQSPITVPKERMLAELGIQEESGPRNPPAHDRPSPPHSGGEVPYGRVGRNDPCPCGSGRKYKKCCGA